MADPQLTVGVKGNTAQLEKQMQAIARKPLIINVQSSGANKLSQPLGKISGQLSEIDKSMAAANARVIAFGASAVAINALESAVTSLFTSFVNTEKQLTNINVLLNLTDKSLGKFASSLFDIAGNTAQSFDVVAEAATELSRQGLGVEETLKRTQAALILTRLSGLDAASSVSALTAAMNSFQSSSLDALEIVNKLANVDASFAVSSADLANAISRVGSSADDAGVSFDELIALVTTAQQVTARGGSVIGNSLKTIFTRLGREKTAKVLEGVGVSTTDANGAQKTQIELLKELASAYDTLGATQKNYIAEQVGGVFQINVLKAALRDLGKEYSIYDQALKTSEGSTNQAILRNEELNKSISALASKAAANLGKTSMTLGEGLFGGATRNVLNLTNVITETVNGVDSESIGGKIGKGLVDGIGNFIAGPGLSIVTAILFKLLGQFTQMGSEAFKSLLGVNQAAKDQAAIQKNVVTFLQNNADIYTRIAKGQLSATDAAEMYLNVIKAQTAELERQGQIGATIARMAAGQVSPRMISGVTDRPVIAAKSKKTAASGFIPNLAQIAAETSGAKQHGYSISPNDVVNRRIHLGDGTSSIFTVNKKEKIHTVTNANGKRATFVIPPNGFGPDTQFAAAGAVPALFGRMGVQAASFDAFAKQKYGMSGEQLFKRKPNVAMSFFKKFANGWPSGQMGFGDSGSSGIIPNFAAVTIDQIASINPRVRANLTKSAKSRGNLEGDDVINISGIKNVFHKIIDPKTYAQSPSGNLSYADFYEKESLRALGAGWRASAPDLKYGATSAVDAYKVTRRGNIVDVQLAEFKAREYWNGTILNKIARGIPENFGSSNSLGNLFTEGVIDRLDTINVSGILMQQYKASAPKTISSNFNIGRIKKDLAAEKEWKAQRGKTIAAGGFVPHFALDPVDAYLQSRSRETQIAAARHLAETKFANEKYPKNAANDYLRSLISGSGTLPASQRSIQDARREKSKRIAEKLLTFNASNYAFITPNGGLSSFSISPDKIISGIKRDKERRLKINVAKGGLGYTGDFGELVDKSIEPGIRQFASKFGPLRGKAGNLGIAENVKAPVRGAFFEAVRSALTGEVVKRGEGNATWDIDRISDVDASIFGRGLVGKVGELKSSTSVGNQESFAAKLASDPRSGLSDFLQRTLVNSAAGGFIPNFAAGIITGDVLRGSDYQKAIARLANTDKPVRTILGPVGSGKTTRAVALGGTVIRSVSEMNKFGEYILDRVGLDLPKKDARTAENLKKIFAKSNSGNALDIMFGSRNTIAALREKRAKNGDANIPDRTSFPIGSGGAGTFVKSIRPFLENYPNSNLIRVRRSAGGFVPNFASISATGYHGRRGFGEMDSLAKMSGTNLAGTNPRDINGIVLSLLGPNYAVDEGGATSFAAQAIAQRATAMSISGPGYGFLGGGSLNVRQNDLYKKSISGRSISVPYKNLSKAAGIIFKRAGLQKDWQSLLSIASSSSGKFNDFSLDTIFAKSKRLRPALQAAFNKSGKNIGLLTDAPQGDGGGNGLRYWADFGNSGVSAIGAASGFVPNFAINRAALEAMANQTVSPNEASIARKKLAALQQKTRSASGLSSLYSDPIFQKIANLQNMVYGTSAEKQINAIRDSLSGVTFGTKAYYDALYKKIKSSGVARPFIPNFANISDTMALETKMSGRPAKFYTSPFPHIRNTSQPTFSSAMADHGGLKNALRDSISGQKAAGLLSNGFVPNFADEGGSGFSDSFAIGGAISSLLFSLSYLRQGLQTSTKEIVEENKKRLGITKELSKKEIDQKRRELVDLGQISRLNSNALKNPDKLNYSSRLIQDRDSARAEARQVSQEIKNQEELNTIRKKARKSALSEKALGIGFTTQSFAGVASQLAGGSGSTGGEIFNAVGNIAGFAGAGASVGGPLAPVAAAAGAAVGVLTSIEPIYKALFTRTKELSEATRLGAENLQKFNDSTQTLLTAQQNLLDAQSSGSATDEKITKAKAKYYEALAALPAEYQNDLNSSKTISETQEKLAKILSEKASAQSVLALKSDLESKDKSLSVERIFGFSSVGRSGALIDAKNILETTRDKNLTLDQRQSKNTSLLEALKSNKGTLSTLSVLGKVGIISGIGGFGASSSSKGIVGGNIDRAFASGSINSDTREALAQQLQKSTTAQDVETTNNALIKALEEDASSIQKAIEARNKNDKVIASLTKVQQDYIKNFDKISKLLENTNALRFNAKKLREVDSYKAELGLRRSGEDALSSAQNLSPEQLLSREILRIRQDADVTKRDAMLEQVGGAKKDLTSKINNIIEQQVTKNDGSNVLEVYKKKNDLLGLNSSISQASDFASLGSIISSASKIGLAESEVKEIQKVYSESTMSYLTKYQEAVQNADFEEAKKIAEAGVNTAATKFAKQMSSLSSLGGGVGSLLRGSTASTRMGIGEMADARISMARAAGENPDVGDLDTVRKKVEQSLRINGRRNRFRGGYDYSGVAGDMVNQYYDIPVGQFNSFGARKAAQNLDVASSMKLALPDSISEKNNPDYTSIISNAFSSSAKYMAEQFSLIKDAATGLNGDLDDLGVSIENLSKKINAFSPSAPSGAEGASNSVTVAPNITLNGDTKVTAAEVKQALQPDIDRLTAAVQDLYGRIRNNS